MRVAFVLAIILIIILCCNFLINIDIKYNLNINLGTVIFKIYKMPIIKVSISIRQNIIEINRKKKSIKINLKLTERQLRIIKRLQKNISTKVLLDSLDLNILLCMEDAFVCSILSGVIDIASNIFFAKLVFDNYDVRVSNIINTGFRHDMITLNLNLGLYISLFDILWAVFATLIWERRVESEERRRKTEY